MNLIETYLGKLVDDLVYEIYMEDILDDIDKCIKYIRHQQRRPNQSKIFEFRVLDKKYDLDFIEYNLETKAIKNNCRNKFSHYTPNNHTANFIGYHLCQKNINIYEFFLERLGNEVINIHSDNLYSHLTINKLTRQKKMKEILQN